MVQASNGTNGVNGHSNGGASHFQPFDNLFFTPVVGFKSDGSVDYEEYRRFISSFLTDEYLEAGIAVIANPEAGELFSLDREERRKIVKICVELAAGRCPVIAGVVDVSTKGYVQCAKDAEEDGADGLFMFPPTGAGDIVAMWDSDSYPEVFTDILLEVAAACPNMRQVIHPVGCYSVKYGQGLPLKTTKAILDAIPQIVGWKMTYNWTGYQIIASFLQGYHRPVSALAAMGISIHDAFANRIFAGTSSGAWNYAKEPMMEHIKLWRAGDWKGATDLWIDGGLRQLQAYIFSDIGRLHVRYKTAVWLRGDIASPLMRAPMPKPRLAEIEAIKKALTRANLPVISDKAIQSAISEHKLVL